MNLEQRRKLAFENMGKELTALRAENVMLHKGVSAQGQLIKEYQEQLASTQRRLAEAHDMAKLSMKLAEVEIEKSIIGGDRRAEMFWRGRKLAFSQMVAEATPPAAESVQANESKENK